MPGEVVPLNKTTHGAKRLLPQNDFRFAAGFHLAGIMVPEFARAATNYPVVFLEDKNAGGFRPVVLLGVNEGRNLFVDAAGKWRATYVPAIIRRYPFSLANTGEADTFLVCIDNDPALLSEAEGAPLFNDDGSAAPLLVNAQTYLNELHQMERATLEFSTFLAGLDLLAPFNIRLEEAGQQRDLTGCFVVNEERLNALSEAQFADLKTRQYLPAIYAHLVSLGQIDRLMMQKAEQSAPPAPAAAENPPAKSAAKKKKNA